MKKVSNKFYLLVIMLLVQIACIKSHAQEEPQKTIQVSKIGYSDFWSDRFKLLSINI